MNDINGNPWDDAISESLKDQQEAQKNSILQKAYDDQREMLADSENADRADRETAAKKQIFMRNLMGVIVKRSGGGPISPRLATWANGVLQKAGVKDGGIMAGGGFGKDGRFVIPTYGMDANGAQVPGQGIAYDGKSLFTMMNQLRGIFSDDDISRGAEFLRKSGVGEKEIASMSYNPFATMLSDRDRARRAMMTRQPTDPDHIKNRMGGGAGGREVGGTATFKGRDTRPHGVHTFGSDGNGGITRSDWTPEDGNTEENLGTRDPKYQGRWKVISSGPRRIKDAYVDENGQRHEAEYENGKRYVNDKTGEEVFVRDGETPPWSNGGMSEKERIARMQDEGRTQRATDKNNTQLKVQQLRNLAKELGYELDEKQLEEKVRHNKAVEEGGAKTQGARANKDQADAAAKELAAIRREMDTADEKRKKELRARESQLQSVVDSFAGIGGGGSEKPVSAADRFGSGGDKGTAPAAAPKGQETPAGGKPKDGAGQASQNAVKKQEPEKKGEQGGSGGKYGLRADGKTYKGTGWLGELKTADGGVATEYTSQSEAVKVDGKRIDFPTLVPTLTKDEVNLMVNDIIPNKKPIPDEIMQKAVDHANMRLSKGESVFANDGQPKSVGENVERKPAPLFDPGAADPFHGLKSRIMRRLKKSDQEMEARRFDEMKSILDGTYHNGDITQGDIEKAKSYFKSKGVDVNDLQKKSEKKERTEKEISENPNDADKLLLADGTTAQFDAKSNEWKVVA